VPCSNAVETRRPVTRENVAIELDHGIQLIDLCVEPMATNELEGLFLVLFRDLGPVLSPEEAARARPAGAGDANVARLEADLREARERLQSTIEQYETALEELKAANEELVSMNEELQSTNEELETTKEEIQSINEELQTVNQKLGIKVDEVNQANTDLSNLFDSTEIAVVFLDRDMTVRSYTPAVGEIFSLIPGDRGRPLTDIATSLEYQGLAEDVRAVVDTGNPRERPVAKRDRSTHYLMRILPYRANDKDRDGALITFGDVTAPAQAEQRQRLLVHEVNHRCATCWPWSTPSRRSRWPGRNRWRGSAAASWAGSTRWPGPTACSPGSAGATWRWARSSGRSWRFTRTAPPTASSKAGRTWRWTRRPP
jgi:two-component system, chemotaxis family, CheB/CheR fusion protein